MIKSDVKEIDEAIFKATAIHCSCGGSGPDDPKACVACKIYHKIQERLYDAFGIDFRNWFLMKE